MSSVTHLAGNVVTVDDRVIQRCSICGEKLVDSKGQMFPVLPGEPPPLVATWEVGALVRVSGEQPQHWEVLQVDEKRLPDDSCIELVE